MPSTRRFSRPVPRVVYSGLCNHQIFDTGCAVDRQIYKFSGVLSAFDAAGTTLTLSGLRAGAASIATAQGLTLTSAELDDFWNRGWISTLITPAEIRGVVEGNVGGDPDAIRIRLPFRENVVGVAIEVFAGCNHSLNQAVGHCDRKFENADRYGGFFFIPTNNPFSIELDRGASDAQPNTVRFGPFKQT